MDIDKTFDNLVKLANKFYNECDNEEDKGVYDAVRNLLSNRYCFFDISFDMAMVILELLKIPNNVKVPYYRELIGGEEYVNYKKAKYNLL